MKLQEAGKQTTALENANWICTGENKGPWRTKVMFYVMYS